MDLIEDDTVNLSLFEDSPSDNSEVGEDSFAAASPLKAPSVEPCTDLPNFSNLKTSCFDASGSDGHGCPGKEKCMIRAVCLDSKPCDSLPSPEHKQKAEELEKTFNTVFHDLPNVIERREAMELKEEGLKKVFADFCRKKKGFSWASESALRQGSVKQSSIVETWERMFLTRLLPFLRLEFGEASNVINVTDDNFVDFLITEDHIQKLIGGWRGTWVMCLNKVYVIPNTQCLHPSCSQVLEKENYLFVRGNKRRNQESLL